MTERVLAVRLRAIVDGYEAAMGRAAAATDKVASTGKQMEQTGRKMSVGFSLPMIAAGGFALRSAVQFESAFAGVTKTVDGTAQQMDSLRSGIIDMATQLPSTREEIAAVAAAAGQLGIETPNVLGFTRTMIDLGNSTDVAAQDAAMSLAQLANITQMSQGDFDRLGSAVVALGNNFPTTESKIIEMSQRLASAGAQIGLSEAEIVGFAAALSSVGIEAEAGGSAISRVMIMIAQSVAAGGDELSKWSQIAGMSDQAFAGLFRSDAAAAISAAVQGLGKLSDTGGDLFGVMEEIGASDIRVGNALRSLAGSGDLLSRTLDMSSDAWDDNIALTAEAGTRYATTESRLRMTANRLTDVARKSGEAMVPTLNAALGVINPLTDGLGDLVDSFSGLAPPIQAASGSIVGLAVASGPTIWAVGKLGQLYGPVVTGLKSIPGHAGTATAAIHNWGTGVASAAVSMRTAAITGQGMSSALAGMGAAIGPQVALVGILAAVGAAMVIAKKRSDELAASHQSGAAAAEQLAKSAGMTLQALETGGDVDAPAVFDEQFRQQNEDAIRSLREIAGLEGQLAYLREIGYGLVLRGVDPDDALAQVRRLAEISGVRIPIEFDVDDISDVEAQIAASVERARRAAEAQEGRGWGSRNEVKLEARLELENIARTAQQLWATDQGAEFVQLLAESEAALGNNARAAEHLGVKTLEALDPDGKMRLSTRNTEDLASALQQLAGPASTASEAQKQLLQTILDTASAMEGGLTPENLAAAAAQHANGQSATELASKQRDATEAASGLGASAAGVADGQQQGAESAEVFAAALDKVAANASFARMDFDAGAAAAQAFSDAMARSTMTASRLGAGMRAGQALKDLREGLTGEKEIAGIRDEVADSTTGAASAVERLSDSVRRADPAMSLLQVRMEAMSAAGEAFTKSISDSSGLDDQITSALSLGDAYDEFSKTFRRLPADLDMTAMATGRLRPRQVEAIQSMLGLGRAARDYLATLIELGRSDAEVAAEAGRMRGEYSRMFAEMGLGQAQIDRYLEAMGLLPRQVTTAISVSGEAAARSRLEAYIGLLEGRIPPEVATNVIAKLEAGDAEAAATMLAEFARTNPAQLAVDTSQLESAGRKIAEVQRNLWDLPRDIDPLKAVLGGYTDSQSAALDAVIEFADGVQQYLSRVAHGGNAEEIRDQAYQIRDAFLTQIGMGDQVGVEYDQMSDGAKRYLDLIGLSDWQIDSAINLTGDTEAIFKIQMYNDMLQGEIPAEISTQVLAAIDEGRLQDGARLLEIWRTDMADGLADNPLIAELLGDDTPARDKLQAFRDYVSETGHGTIAVDADTAPAATGVQAFRDHVSTHPPTASRVGADTSPALADLGGLHRLIPLFGNTVTIDANTKPAESKMNAFLAQFPIFNPGGIFGPGIPSQPASLPGMPGYGGIDGNPVTPFALGGRVRGAGSNRSDGVRARLSNDEYVVQAFAARSIGYDRLDLANRTGILPGETRLTPVLPDMDQIMDRAARKIAELVPVAGDHLEFTGPIVAPTPERVPRAIAEATGTARHLAGRRR